MKKFLTLTAALVQSLGAKAAKAYPEPIMVTQANGERITIVTAAADIDRLAHPHGGRNDHLYADGHAEAVNMYAVCGDWRAWCQPYSYMPYRVWSETGAEW